MLAGSMKTTPTVLTLIMLTLHHQQLTILAVHTLQLQLLMLTLQQLATPLTTLRVPLATHMGPVLTQVGPIRQHHQVPIQLAATPLMHTQAENTHQRHRLATLVMLQPMALAQPAIAMPVELV